MMLAVKPRFPLGQVFATPGALLAVEEARASLSLLLRRHQCGEWGETCAEDAQMNEDAITGGARILSVYCLKGGEVLWIITEADRASTTALLPSEY